MASMNWPRAVRAAGRVVGKRGRLARLLGAAAVLAAHPKVGLGKVRGDLEAMLRMARETAAGRYRHLPRRSLMAVTAGLIYFVSPLDLIPDVIPMLGFVDDVGVLAWVVHQVRRDLDGYLDWERGLGDIVDGELVDGHPADGNLAEGEREEP